MRQCARCKIEYKASSRHKLCPKCRNEIDKRSCPRCGKLMQRKSKICKSCYLKSKQYPISRKKHLSKNGYIYVYFKAHHFADKEGRVFEHRLVMEKKLKRYLLPIEKIHHKNGVKTDNSIKNLELWTKPQPIGARVEDVVKWAREILKLYGDVTY